MSTSLKVVSMAAVCCACTSLVAMVWRIRDIGSRHSSRSRPPETGGRGGALAGAFAVSLSRFAAGAGFVSSLPDLRCSRWARTSCLVTRPSLPVPRIAPGSRPCSASSALTAGPWRSASADSPAFALAVSSDFSSCAGFPAAACGLPLSACSAGAPPSSITARESPSCTVSPAPWLILPSVPSWGAGTSRTTFSVSSSTSVSSRRTKSPSFLCHSSTVASETDSGRVGTLISLGIGCDLPLRGLAGGRVRDGERLLQQFVGLLDVQLVEADRRRRRGLAPGVQARLPGRKAVLEVMGNLVPRALVLGFLLAPYDDVGVAVLHQHLGQAFLGERVQLLDADDGRVELLAADALLVQLVVDLAAAQDDAVHALRGNLLDFVDDSLE